MHNVEAAKPSVDFDSDFLVLRVSPAVSSRHLPLIVDVNFHR
jgi:hypothetical protein